MKHHLLLALCLSTASTSALWLDPKYEQLSPGSAYQESQDSETQSMSPQTPAPLTCSQQPLTQATLVRLLSATVSQDSTVPSSGEQEATTKQHITAAVHISNLHERWAAQVEPSEQSQESAAAASQHSLHSVTATQAPATPVINEQSQQSWNWEKEAD